MNVVFHKTDNILTLVIHFTVYITVKDGPASAKLQHLSGRDVHEHASLLVVNPVVHTGYVTSACFTYFLGNGFQNLIHFMNVLASIHTNSINFTFLLDTKIWKVKLTSKRMSLDVVKCQRHVRLYDIIRSGWGTGCLPAKIKTPGMETPSACPNWAKTGWVFSVNCKVYITGFTTCSIKRSRRT